MAEIIYKIENVTPGQKANWPNESDYVEPTKKNYRFNGWDFDWENTVITEDTDIHPVWQKVVIKADANHTIISGDGDNPTDPTKMYYWAEVSDATPIEMITNNINYEKVELESDELPIVFDGSETTTIEGNKNVRSGKVKENDINKSRFLRFKAVTDDFGGIESEVIEIEQVGKDQTVLPDFDFLTFTYNWDSNDGTDLDTATFVIGTNIPIGDSGKTLDDYPVGFGCSGSSTIDPDYSGGTSSNPTLFAEISKYIKGGGDNMQSGNETALINWKEICDRDFISQGITKLKCELYANWYGERKNGNCIVKFRTYKTESGSGSMELDRDTAGKSLYTFSPTGDTTLKTDTQISGNVYASSSLNAVQRKTGPNGNESDFYSHVATLIYDVKSKSAVLYNMMSTPTGRNIRLETSVNGEVFKQDGTTSHTYRYDYNGDDLFQITCNIEKVVLTVNGTNYNCKFKYSDEELKNEMKWFTGDADWLDIVSVSRDSDDYIKSITFKANSKNTSTTVNRDMDLYLRQTFDGVTGTLGISIYHNKIVS